MAITRRSFRLAGPHHASYADGLDGLRPAVAFLDTQRRPCDHALAPRIERGAVSIRPAHASVKHPRGPAIKLIPGTIR